MELFQGVITRIPLYGAEIWGTVKNLEHCGKIVHSFLGRTLGLRNSTPKHFLWQEIGKFLLSPSLKSSDSDL